MLSVLQQRFTIPTRKFADFALETGQPDGVFLIEVEVVQQPGKSDDVGLVVVDEENWKLWKHNQHAIGAGATPTALEKPTTFTTAKLSHGTVAFTPPQAGSYYGILDNTYSTWTSKVVDVKAYWMWFEDARFRFIDRALKARKWDDISTLIANAKAALETGGTVDACNALRMALIATWANVFEVVTGQKPPFEKGKTPDVGFLGGGLTQKGVSEDSVSVIKRIWSYVSELAHVEKAQARPPSIEDTSFGFGLTISAILHLLRLLPEERHGSSGLNKL